MVRVLRDCPPRYVWRKELGPSRTGTIVANYASCNGAGLARLSSKMRLAEWAARLPTEKVARSGFSGNLAFAIDLM
jgi:hypothetical protein